MHGWRFGLFNTVGYCTGTGTSRRICCSLFLNIDGLIFLAMVATSTGQTECLTQKGICAACVCGQMIQLLCHPLEFSFPAGLFRASPRKKQKIHIHQHVHCMMLSLPL
jgi:hypothetical protein